MSHVDLFTIVTHPEVCDASPFSSGSYSLYASPGLKGQFILAPGNAWGIMINEKPVRAKMLIWAIQ